MYNSNSKDIDVEQYLIREMVMWKEISIVYDPSEF